MSPDFGARVQPDGPNGGDWPGVEGYRRMVDTWMEVWDSFRVVPAFVYTSLFVDGKLARIGIWNDETLAREDLEAG